MTVHETWCARLASGVVALRGRESVDLLHRLSSQDLRPLDGVSGTRMTVLTTNQGRVLDWARVISQAGETFLLTSPGRGAAVARWLAGYVIMEDVQVEDVTSAWALVACQGPEMTKAVGRAAPPQYVVEASGKALAWAGLPAYGDRLEVLLAAADVEDWIASVSSRGAVRADSQRVEAARIAAGVPGPEGEFPDEQNPLELRLADSSVSFSKGCYIGQEVISRLDSYDKVARLLMGFEGPAGPALLDTIAPASQAPRLLHQGRPLGRVTSAVVDGAYVTGLALVKRELAVAGEVELSAGGASWPVQLVDRPFWHPQ